MQFSSNCMHVFSFGYRFSHSFATKTQFFSIPWHSTEIGHWWWKSQLTMATTKISKPENIKNRHSNVGPIVVILGASAAAVGFKRFLPFVPWTCPPGSQVLSQIAIPRLMIDAGSIRLLIMNYINSGSFWIIFLHFSPGDLSCYKRGFATCSKAGWIPGQR